jgi:hypothetical protein
MNEAFGFFRMLWRVRGGFEMTLKFNSELDHRDFIFTIDPDSHTYTANLYFKIDDDGNYVTNCDFNFINNYKHVVTINGFDYIFNGVGKWTEAEKTKIKKVFFIKQAAIDTGPLPLAACFSSISVSERLFLANVSKTLDPNSIVVDVDSGLGGRASILAHANPNIQIYSIESFRENSLKNEFDTMASWIREQLVDVCKDVGEKIDTAYQYLADIDTAFNKDPNGKEVWIKNTNKFNNIKLLDHYDLGVNMCLIKNPMLDKVSKWLPQILPNGYLVVHVYSIQSEVDQYIRSTCKLIRQVDNIILFQKL